MLDSLMIKNFRNLKELKINSLGRVNLIIGKNNTGKTAVLEAIAIYATKGDFDTIFEQLEERGENLKKNIDGENILKENIRTFSSLFTNRKAGYEKESAIYIGNIESIPLDGEVYPERLVSIRFFDSEISKKENGREYVLTLDDRLALNVKFGKRNTVFLLGTNRPFVSGFTPHIYAEEFQFVRTANIEREKNRTLFDNIVIKDKEQVVIDALRIIEPATEQIIFLSESNAEQSPIIKLSNIDNPIPLKSMGDGINRILTIILALVNSENGYLLIDEFENGLHHSVQEKLWEVIFSLAEKLNVQVFATTHSDDCIYGYESVLNGNDKYDGKMIRLDNKNGIIKAVEFDKIDLEVICESQGEIR